MKNLELLSLYRDWEFERRHYGRNGNSGNGVFNIQSEEHPLETLRIIASDGGNWEHVSVSLKDRCPTWGEMEQVARLFFNDGEDAMQLHVPSTDHVNCHPYCLHWWRPLHQPIPRPPKHMIA